MNYLDLMPEEIKQLIYKNVFDDCMGEMKERITTIDYTVKYIKEYIYHKDDIYIGTGSVWEIEESKNYRSDEFKRETQKTFYYKEGDSEDEDSDEE